MPDTTKPAEDIIDAERAAEILQVHYITLYKLARAKKIPARKIGGQWRFSERTLREFVQGKKAVA